MVVQHNMQAANASRMLNITANAQSKSTEKLSSGYRINRAADDAAGLSISEKMRKQIRGLDRASTNAQDGVSAVQTAEGALNEVHSMLQRMNELAVQAANGTNSSADIGSIRDEITALNNEIKRVASSTDFNGKKLLQKDQSVSIFVGYTTDVYNNIGISSIDLKGSVYDAISGATFMSAANKSAAATVQSSAAQSFLANISSAIEKVSKFRSDFGAVQNRLEHTIDNLDNVVENVTSAESRIRDTDMADEMVKYSKNNILTQAGQSMLAQANQSTQGVLSLLQ
ncbi:MAG: flagellin [Lachnobacterium sp.]|nr:flagellin [Lachnobacterium sp.]